MTASELLDRIIEQFQSLPPNAKMSEQINANQNAIKIIEDALLGEYEKGCNDTSEKMRQMEIEKQMKNN